MTGRKQHRDLHETKVEARDERCSKLKFIATAERKQYQSNVITISQKSFSGSGSKEKGRNVDLIVSKLNKSK